MLWLLESDVFGPGPHPLTAAAKAAGHAVKAWDDDWWATEKWPAGGGPVLFHGSLGNAAQVVGLQRWAPGAFCAVQNFHCSAWYPAAADWLVHERYVCTTVAALVADPSGVAGGLADAAGEVFVRPDSPLKPFSGRVVALAGLTAAALDHGFYYDDLELPIIVSGKQKIGEECRFVVVGRQVVAASHYEAETRRAQTGAVGREMRVLAEAIASSLAGPELAYILDIAETERGLKLMERNPFSGADLYACDAEAVVTAVGRAVAANPAYSR